MSERRKNVTSTGLQCSFHGRNISHDCDKNESEGSISSSLGVVQKKHGLDDSKETIYSEALVFAYWEVGCFRLAISVVRPFFTPRVFHG